MYINLLRVKAENDDSYELDIFLWTHGCSDLY